ncbi:MAG: Cu(I)-responsive transcriptional regulator [bacterium]
MKIGQAAKGSGLTTKTVRYYANIGLVHPTVDPLTGYRQYNQSDVAKLKFVGTARKFDFSIEDCRELLGLYEDKHRPSRDVKKVALKKIKDIESRLSELQSLKEELLSLVNACDGDDRPNCPIIDRLSGAKI